MISICIPSYNRTTLLFEAVESAIHHDLIDEVVISDDCSSPKIQEEIFTKYINTPKVKLHLNNENLGIARNKKRSVELATNDWCIFLDNDNTLSSNYLEVIYSLKSYDINTIYCPEFASPNFNYQIFSGKEITKLNIREFRDKEMFHVLLNTGNNFFHGQTYLDVYKDPEKLFTAVDTATFNLNWLESGRTLYVVPGLTYNHRIHDDSFFMKNVNGNMDEAGKIKEIVNSW